MAMAKNDNTHHFSFTNPNLENNNNNNNNNINWMYQFTTTNTNINNNNNNKIPLKQDPNQIEYEGHWFRVIVRCCYYGGGGANKLLVLVVVGCGGCVSAAVDSDSGIDCSGCVSTERGRWRWRWRLWWDGDGDGCGDVGEAEAVVTSERQKQWLLGDFLIQHQASNAVVLIGEAVVTWTVVGEGEDWVESYEVVGVVWLVRERTGREQRGKERECGRWREERERECGRWEEGEEEVEGGGRREKRRRRAVRGGRGGGGGGGRWKEGDKEAWFFLIFFNFVLVKTRVYWSFYHVDR